MRQLNDKVGKVNVKRLMQKKYAVWQERNCMMVYEIRE